MPGFLFCPFLIAPKEQSKEGLALSSDTFKISDLSLHDPPHQWRLKSM